MGNSSSTPLEGPVDESFHSEDRSHYNANNSRTNSNNSGTGSNHSSNNNLNTSTVSGPTDGNPSNANNANSTSVNHNKYKAFPGSTILEKTFCGSIDTTDPSEYEDISIANRLLKRADILCVSSPGTDDGDDVDVQHGFSRNAENSIVQSRDGRSVNPNPNSSSSILARALVSEVTDNPKTMTPAAMTMREKNLLKAQTAANSNKKSAGNKSMSLARPIGAPGGVGPPRVLNSLAYALTGDDTPPNLCVAPGDASHNHSMNMSMQSTATSATSNNMSDASHMTPGPLQESRNAHGDNHSAANTSHSHHSGGNNNSNSIIQYDTGGYNPNNPHAVTIGLSLSRRAPDNNNNVGHPATVTRQTAFDFNELQDRAYKYVSSTDSAGWRAGGGERGGAPTRNANNNNSASGNDSVDGSSPPSSHAGGVDNASLNSSQEKLPQADMVHIAIIHLDCPDAATVDQIIHALASGEIFIPHMAVIPEALSVSGASPPDLVVRFGCERNDDLPADEWPNWCLEFMHNQLYEYFYAAGAKWNKRPFGISLAGKVRWKTVKHMNRYFAHAERVIDAWREQGPQYLNPELSYIEGGATPEEVAQPHGIYLFRRGVPTNYFSPNFEPPYTTKMTRSLLQNVLNKSWDKKRREWSVQPIPKLVTPTLLMAAACGCADPSAGGFMASEVTTTGQAAKMAAAAAALANSANVNMPPPPQQSHQLMNSNKMMEHVEVARSEVNLGGNNTHTNSLLASSMDDRDDNEQDEEDDDDDESVAKHSKKPSMEEEKKNDEPGTEASSSHQRGGGTRSSAQQSTRSNRSMVSHGTDAPSEFGQSVAMSGTTVMHTNLASNRLFSDEDWDDSLDLNRLDTQQEWTKKNAPGENYSDNNSNDDLQRKIAAEKSKHTKNLQAAQSLLDREKAKAPAGSYRTNPGVDTSESGLSLEYSADGSSAFFNQDGGGFGSAAAVAAGHQYASAGANAKQAGRQEEDDESLSIQESVSSGMSVVPTDEELFAVGWAKALDPSSGNYYYFTLDRSMTIWENPLNSK
jgi:hypothetical protein